MNNFRWWCVVCFMFMVVINQIVLFSIIGSQNKKILKLNEIISKVNSNCDIVNNIITSIKLNERIVKNKM